MGFQKAKREQIWTKVLLASPSGGGKTYSALRLAKGIAQGCNSRVAAIDTENGRIRYYADEFDFDDMQLEEPFTPESYIEAINQAIDAGYKVLIIDSLSHEWAYCLEVHNKMPGNSYTNWAKITPRHDALMEQILQAPVHVVATVRGKDEYVMEEKNGKQVPKKVGLGYNQRDNTEYNYTVTFNIDQNTHVADVMKDNTHLFEGRYDMLTERDGLAIYNWANKGDAPAEKPNKEPTEPVVDPLVSAMSEIDKVAKELVGNGVDKSAIGDAVKSVIGSANYHKVDSVENATAIVEALKKLEGNN